MFFREKYFILYIYNMPNMSLGKRARYVASITNKPTCGGNKKAGLLSTVGRSSLLMLRPATNRGYNKMIWPVNCQMAVSGKNAAGHSIMRYTKNGQQPIGPMPLSVNPQCSGGVGRVALVQGCDVWRW